MSSRPRMHSMIFTKDKYIDVPVTNIDNLMRKIGITHVDILKIDVEGAEIEVLKGTRNLLNQKGLNIVLAAYHTKNQADELESFLKNKGFHVRPYYINNSFIYPYIYAINQKNKS